MILGAAIGSSMPNVPVWAAAYEQNSVGGVMGAMLNPLGGFGKFLLVLMALSVLANVAGTVYALALNCQAMLYTAHVRVPRIICNAVVIAVILPTAIGVSTAAFLESLHNFLGVISYWSACFIAIVLVEHFVFRTGKVENYDLDLWNSMRELPSGRAALGAGVLSFGLVIPCMNQLWFVGPIAQRTGDLGVETALVVTSAFYMLFRWIDIRVRGKV